ncbi:mechanosensitive ion channel protein MscS [Mariprofundus erugo]|uniref:Mechanosensitive ion channel protein MscS n=1 Tax=Mariprofundus erugo TaxID=2528639 RepID=A0A5R9GLY0_9PROT|nr:mechanosensitive ion channel protein MscS [Mariprofundus erugo]TLS65307.1 mechanosensitive ion channel protein MscS [Mariprofundus erugo]
MMRILHTGWITLMLCGLIAPLPAYAGNGSESHSGQAALHSGKASGQLAQSAGHATASGAQVVSGIAAVPLVAAGAVGASAATSGNALANAADQPLEVSDEVMTAGPSPDQMLGNHKANKQ